ncbi:hypothetical protein [Bacillus pumilus]|uniref:hypothetical protein n=1 Tax=Bacillus pumilus TaxID=1408 RepID=UPI0015EBC8F3|nr:hypothetical protein [Bacillus pumilus]
MKFVWAAAAVVGFITWVDCFKPTIIESITVYLITNASMLAIFSAAMEEASQ